MVPVVGVEPTRYRYHWILSPARLPIPSYRRATDILYHIPPEKSRAFCNFLQIILLFHIIRLSTRGSGSPLCATLQAASPALLRSFRGQSNDPSCEPAAIRTGRRSIRPPMPQGLPRPMRLSQRRVGGIAEFQEYRSGTAEENRLPKRRRQHGCFR